MRLKEEALETRNRILDSAEQVFMEKGVSNILGAICRCRSHHERGDMSMKWHRFAGAKSKRATIASHM